VTDPAAAGRIVLVACPDPGIADQLARGLVEARLAACVQQLPGVRSTYRWQGRLEQSDEVLLLAKTVADRVAPAIAWLRSRHPYELPEILAVEAVAGLDAYLQWLGQETRPAQDRSAE
jgi:periplasmic divalent cation tolerance protein